MAAVDRELVDALERQGSARMFFESLEFHGIAAPQESSILMKWVLDSEQKLLKHRDGT